MSYNGYRVIIEGTTVPDNLIARGSWNFDKKKRITGSYVDGNQIEHEDVLPNRKVDIQFAIKPRTLEEQETIKGIFQKQEHVSVTYWDDWLCEYRTGDFKMDSPACQHKNTLYGTINYLATPIHLMEY